MADSSRSAKSASPREENRSYKSRGEHRGGHGLVDGRLDRPAALAGVRNAAGELRQLLVLQQGLGRQVQQPGGDHAAPPPDFGDVAQVEVVLIVFGIAQRRRFGVDLFLVLADVGVLQNGQPLGIGRHDAVLDAVVDHLDEVPGPVGAAVQIAVLGGAGRILFLAARRARGGIDRRGERGEDRIEQAGRSALRRRSSGNSRAPGPTRRRWCRRRRNAAPWSSARRRGGCRRCSRSCRRRSRCRPRRARATRSCSVRSTTPAGTISQTDAGGLSFCASSSSDDGAYGPLFHQFGDGRRMHVVNHALVPRLQEPPHHVGPHPAQTDHSELHDGLLGVRFLTRPAKRTYEPPGSSRRSI